jgi:two-component system sensor histidine kinase KdpD
MNANTPTPPRGRLKVFLGYASGVGKSFQMIDEGRRRHERGQDIIVGALQPEVPDEVRRILSSLAVVPTLDIQGVPVIDVPAIIRRHPQICLIDGLAYDNPAGSRNAHRWQDVEELLSAGITVVGSVNLQHIADQREAVEKITGRTVTDTIPREFLNAADEIVVVDAPTEGAPPEISKLREMALVLSADVLDAGLQRYLQAHGIEPLWGTNERIMICLTPRTHAEHLVASARRNADRFHCDVLGVYVKQRGLSERDQKAVQNALAVARAAGIHVNVLEGEDVVERIVEFARTHGVTQIFVGHGLKTRWRTRLFGSAMNRLIRLAHGMDIRVFPH